MKKTIFICLYALVVWGVVSLLTEANAFCEELPKVGSTLPAFTLPSPSLDSDITYLGLGNKKTFQLKDINCQVLVVEIIGVYCPKCYEQAPSFNRLYNRLKEEKDASNIKILAIAAGGTPMEIDMLRNERYEFPIMRDESFSVHKVLGEPKTPFTVVISRQGRVYYSHLGVLKDIDSLYTKIKQLARSSTDVGGQIQKLK